MRKIRIVILVGALVLLVTMVLKIDFSEFSLNENGGKILTAISLILISVSQTLMLIKQDK